MDIDLDEGGNEEVGAWFNPRALRAMAIRRARSRVQVRRAAFRQPARPVTLRRKIVATAFRKQPLGLGSLTLGAGVAGTLSAVVQKASQFDRLVLGGVLADFTVQDIKIGTESQLAGVASLPAALFANVAVNAGVSFAPAATGITVSVSVTNTSAGALTITGAFLGTAAGS